MDRKINRALAAARSGRGRLHRYPHSTSMNQRGYAGRGNEPDDIAVKSRPVDEILKVAGFRLPGAMPQAKLELDLRPNVRLTTRAVPLARVELGLAPYILGHDPV